MNTQVEKIVLSNQRKASSLLVNMDGQNKKIPISAAILAAGSLETPFLLKNSTQFFAPNGLGNDTVGRYLIDSRIVSQIVYADEEHNAYAGIPIDICVDEFEGEQILLSQGRNLAGITGPMSLAKMYAKYHGAHKIREWMAHYYSRIGVIGAFMESGGHRNDTIGIGKKTFSIKKTQKDIQNEQYVSNLLTQWRVKADLKSLWDDSFYQSQLSGSMIRGSCRMGKSPRTSAINTNGRLYGYDNIYVADSSMLSSGLIAHPSLLLQTLSFNIGTKLSGSLVKG